MTTILKKPSGEKSASSAQILIVDDHPIVREGYEQMIARHDDLEVCAVASDAVEALRMCEEGRAGCGHRRPFTQNEQRAGVVQANQIPVSQNRHARCLHA